MTRPQERLEASHARACVGGCTTRDHNSACDNDTCTGCMPRQATHGQLCDRCWANLSRDVATAPALVEWLRQHIEPGAPSDETRVDGSRVPPAPLNVAAVADADDLHATLASWVLLVLEENPADLRGPSWGTTAVTKPSKRRVTADVDDLGYPARLKYGEPAWSMVCYDQPQPAGAKNADATSTLVGWLIPHLPWASDQPWAGEMAREIGSLSATLLARYPQASTARPIPGMPCPECDRISLVYYPVQEFGAAVIVQCEHHDCGHQIDEDKWAWTAKVIADERRSA